MSTPGSPIYASSASSLRFSVVCSCVSFTVSNFPTSVGLNLFPLLRFTCGMGYRAEEEPPSASTDREFIFPYSSSGVQDPVVFHVVLSTVSFISMSTAPVGAECPFPVFPSVSPSVMASTSIALYVAGLVFSGLYFFVVYYRAGRHRDARYRQGASRSGRSRCCYQGRSTLGVCSRHSRRVVRRIRRCKYHRNIVTVHRGSGYGPRGYHVGSLCRVLVRRSGRGHLCGVHRSPVRSNAFGVFLSRAPRGRFFRGE